MDHGRGDHGLSARRACRVLGVARSTYRYKRRRPKDGELRQRLRALAHERVRFGYRRLHRLLRNQGLKVNRKKVYRLYREENLAVRRKSRRRLKRIVRSPQPAAERPNQRWGMDFISDSLRGGRRFRVLCVLDLCTRESLELEVDLSLPGARVVAVLERLFAERGVPESIVCDNGPEFTSRALGECAEKHGFLLDFIEPGKPSQNAHVESFNGRLRDECLDQHWFLGLADARATIAAWKHDYNTERPHGSLGGLSPLAYLKTFQEQFGDQVERAA